MKTYKHNIGMSNLRMGIAGSEFSRSMNGGQIIDIQSGKDLNGKEYVSVIAPGTWATRMILVMEDCETAKHEFSINTMYGNTYRVIIEKYKIDDPKATAGVVNDVITDLIENIEDLHTGEYRDSNGFRRLIPSNNRVTNFRKRYASENDSKKRKKDCRAIFASMHQHSYRNRNSGNYRTRYAMNRGKTIRLSYIDMNGVSDDILGIRRSIMSIISVAASANDYDVEVNNTIYGKLMRGSGICSNDLITSKNPIGNLTSMLDMLKLFGDAVCNIPNILDKLVRVIDCVARACDNSEYYAKYNYIHTDDELREITASQYSGPYYESFEF